MKPVTTPDTNLTYTLPGGTTKNDLPCYRESPGLIVSEWDLTKAERLAIARGGRIELNIHAEPIPPVALHVVKRHGPHGRGSLDYIDEHGPFGEPLTPGELAGRLDDVDLARTIADRHDAALVSLDQLRAYTDDALELRALRAALDAYRARSWWRRLLGVKPKARG